MRERILIIFIAIALGLIITTLVYFLYQQTKTIPQKAPGVSGLNSTNPTPTKTPGYLTISTPSDESITNKRLLQVKGQTKADDTIVVSTNQEDVVATPATDGKFSVSLTMDAGANLVIIRSIDPAGNVYKDVRTVTFTTEEF